MEMGYVCTYSSDVKKYNNSKTNMLSLCLSTLNQTQSTLMGIVHINRPLNLYEKHCRGNY